MTHFDPNAQPSPDLTPIRMGQFDRLTITGIHYTLNQASETGLYLNVDDATGRARFFSHEELRDLAFRKRLRMEPNFHRIDRVQARQIHGDLALTDLAPKPLARTAWRLSQVESLNELYHGGEVKLRDDVIDAEMDRIVGLATQYIGRHPHREFGHCHRTYDNAARVNASTLRKWRTAYEKYGISALIDNMDKRGGKGSSLAPKVQAVMWRHVKDFQSRNKPSPTQIFERVREAVEQLNDERRAEGLPTLAAPSKTTVRNAIGMLDPCATHVARHGEESARKKYRPTTNGLDLTYPLQRVEIDEHKLDLISFIEQNDWRDKFTDGQWEELKLSKGKGRLFITLALCCTTRAIVGVTITPTPNAAAALKTLSMIMSDKGMWADLVGSLGAWNMYGRPEVVVTDCGSAFRSENFRFACADLGITAIRAKAGNPEQRGRGERIFRTVAGGLCARLSGYTFSDIFKKGDSDPSSIAAFTLEDLAYVLVRWIEDIYHHTPHEGLGGETPAACWNRLAAEYGVNPPPSMDRFRLAFGSRYQRSLTKSGVTVLGVRYHSPALADHMMRRDTCTVEVRWHPEDIGTVSVRLGDEWHNVPAVIDGLDGVHADSWLRCVRDYRQGRHAAKDVDLQIVRQALVAIGERNQEAVLAAGLSMDDWTEERIAKAEDRIFEGVTFREPAAAPAPDGRIGIAIPEICKGDGTDSTEPRKPGGSSFGIEED